MKNKNSRNKARTGGSKAKPPQIQSNVRVNHTFRFQSTAATPTNVTNRTLLQACGVMAATTILGYPIVSSVRVKRVKVWTPFSAANSTCSLVWYGSVDSQFSNIEISDSSVSSALPAHISTAPPARSNASFFQWDNQSTTNTLFQLVAPAYSFIDVDVEYVLADGGNATAAASLVLVGATAGQLYYEPLDGRGGIFIPVSLTTN